MARGAFFADRRGRNEALGDLLIVSIALLGTLEGLLDEIHRFGEGQVGAIDAVSAGCALIRLGIADVGADIGAFTPTAVVTAVFVGAVRNTHFDVTHPGFEQFAGVRKNILAVFTEHSFRAGKLVAVPFAGSFGGFGVALLFHDFGATARVQWTVRTAHAYGSGQTVSGQNTVALHTFERWWTEFPQHFSRSAVPGTPSI